MAFPSRSGCAVGFLLVLLLKVRLLGFQPAIGHLFKVVRLNLSTYLSGVDNRPFV